MYVLGGNSWTLQKLKVLNPVSSTCISEISADTEIHVAQKNLNRKIIIMFDHLQEA